MVGKNGAEEWRGRRGLTDPELLRQDKIQSILLCMSVTAAILLAGGRPPDPPGAGPTSATEGEVT